MEAGSIFHPPFHGEAILVPVDLDPGSLDGGTLPGIEPTILNSALVGRLRYFSPQSIDLLDQLPLSQSPYRRIAGEHADPVLIHSKEEGFTSQTGRGQSGLNAGMTAADYDDVVL
jgi:hypothetical protein